MVQTSALAQRPHAGNLHQPAADLGRTGVGPASISRICSFTSRSQVASMSDNRAHRQECAYSPAPQKRTAGDEREIRFQARGPDKQKPARHIGTQTDPALAAQVGRLWRFFDGRG